MKDMNHQQKYSMKLDKSIKIKSMLSILIIFLTVFSENLFSHSNENESKNVNFNQQTINIIKKEWSVLDITKTTAYNASTEQYFQHFDLNLKNCTHYYGYFLSSDYKISTHIFKPEQSFATVFVVHGYLSHTGHMTELIEYLLNMNLTVVAFDLPGHGMSDGSPADINSFSTYSLVIHDFIKLYGKDLSENWHLIGHSTGSSAIIDYLCNYENIFRSVTIVSPLIHSVYWDISKFGEQVFGKIIDTIPRVFRRSSTDKEYLRFIKKNDPLQTRKIPLNWTSSLIKWNVYLQNISPLDDKVFIIQGKKDIIVDWKYNIPFLQSLFPNSQTIYIEKGKHDLFNESDSIKTRVFDQINKIIKMR